MTTARLYHTPFHPASYELPTPNYTYLLTLPTNSNTSVVNVYEYLPMSKCVMQPTLSTTNIQTFRMRAYQHDRESIILLYA